MVAHPAAQVRPVAGMPWNVARCVPRACRWTASPGSAEGDLVAGDTEGSARWVDWDVLGILEQVGGVTRVATASA